MFYALCHAVDSFLGKGKNAPKKSPAGMACRCFAARLCRPPRLGRYTPSALQPAQPRKTNSQRIYRRDVALTAARSARLSLFLYATSWIPMILSNLWPETLADRLLSTMSVGGFAASNWMLFKAMGQLVGPTTL
jgi:hypothetical protein